MKAIKGNREYTITEAEKATYQKRGFDIKDDDGKTIEYGAGKSVSYDKYKELVDSYKKLEDKCISLEKENEELKLSAMTVDQLKAYAVDRKVNLGDATTREAILAKFKEALGIAINSNSEQTANEPK